MFEPVHPTPTKAALRIPTTEPHRFPTTKRSYEVTDLRLDQISVACELGATGESTADFQSGYVRSECGRNCFSKTSVGVLQTSSGKFVIQNRMHRYNCAGANRTESNEDLEEAIVNRCSLRSKCQYSA